MINFLQTNNPSECCGCNACISVCPKKCIKMNSNDEGFLYPIKDTVSCIDCGLCEKVCPFSDNYVFETTINPKVYAAYDRVNRSGSSSGGIFFALAKYVIEEKRGWVFGAAFENKFQLRHVGVNTISGLQKLRGSKYLQSYMGDTYIKIKKLLTEGVFIFFVGTPCQVAGIRAFLRKDYENLLLVDLVCHGVPSQYLFDEHVKFLEEKHKAELVSYQFRKADGWGVCEIADFANPEKHKVLPSYYLSPYLYSFMYAMTYRESCYKCKFAKVPRQGDITLADYWGVKEFFPKMDTSKGISLVLLNTKKGVELYDAINDNSDTIISQPSKISDASKYNSNMMYKSVRPEIRDLVYEEIKNKGYSNVVYTRFRAKNYALLKCKTYMLQCDILKKIMVKLLKVIRHGR